MRNSFEYVDHKGIYQSQQVRTEANSENIFMLIIEQFPCIAQ